MRSVKYIKIPAVAKKLKEGDEKNIPVYICGGVGYGKTAAVKNYYKKKAHLWLDVENLGEYPSVDDIDAKTVVVDNISLIGDGKDKEYAEFRAYISDIMKNPKKNVVMIGRGKLPRWLISAHIEMEFILINDNDLLLKQDIVVKLFESMGVELPKKHMRDICQYFRGYPLALIVAALVVRDYGYYSEEVREVIVDNVFAYLDDNMYEGWSDKVKETIIALSEVENFTFGLAEVITGDSNIIRTINRIIANDKAITPIGNGAYCVDPRVVTYINRKKINGEIDFDRKDILTKTGEYYAGRQNIQKALEYYSKAESNEHIRELLIKNSNMNAADGYYREMRKYYFNLPDEYIESSPTIMSAVSQVYSLTMQPEKSEYWYDKLKAFSKDKRNSREDIKIAQIGLHFLDITLPHRGSKHAVTTLCRMARFKMEKGVELPEFSVTSNLPSILNGGLDFSHWTKRDRFLYRTMKRTAEFVLGKYGAGLANVSLAESLFEKGHEDYYEIMTLLNNAHTEAEQAGKMQVRFVIIALLSKLHLVRNQPDLARLQMSEFKKCMVEKGAEKLISNYDTFITGINLLENKLQEVKDWMEKEAPNENIDFFIMDRYRYITKVRCYISLSMYDEAIKLIERLDIYFVQYNRIYMRMENQVLKAIVQYRTGSSQWKDTLKNVFPELEEYHYVHLIGKEGIAIRPLLRELDDQGEINVNEEFFNKIRDYADKMAMNYPNYMKYHGGILDELTETEEKILRLYSKGVDTDTVCDLCNFSYNTLKFHNKKIYKKLQVSNRIEAERKAKELGI